MVFSTTALATVPPGFLLEGPATYHTLGADKLGELGSLAENGEYEDGASSVLRWKYKWTWVGTLTPSSHTLGLRLGGAAQQPVTHSELQEEENSGSRVHYAVGAAGCQGLTCDPADL